MNILDNDKNKAFQGKKRSIFPLAQGTSEYFKAAGNISELASQTM